jgi:hypothetical protein
MKNLVFSIILAACACGAESSEHESKYISLERIFNIPKKSNLPVSTLNQFQIKEGVIRLWAHSVRDNKSYLLWLQEAGGTKLLEFDKAGQKLLKSRPVQVPKWLRELIQTPLDLSVQDMQIGATIQHVFIIESVTDGKYHWAFRKLDRLESATKSDYSKLLSFLEEASAEAIDVGWTINEDLIQGTRK